MLTFREWGEQWIVQRRAEAPRSVKRLLTHWQCHLLEAPFVDRPLDQIKRPDVRAFLAERATRPARHEQIAAGRARELVSTSRTLSPTTIRHLRQTLHQLMRAAVEDEVIANNPVAGVRLRLAQRDPTWTYLTATEIATLETASALSEERRAIYLTAIYTGLRKGELWGLRWSDVYLGSVRPHIVVARSMNGPPKNGKIQTIPLIARAERVLARWSARTRQDTELVFARRSRARLGEMRGRHDTAGWRDYRSSGRAPARGWCSKLIGRRVRFHDLRHTCASHLLIGTWGRRWSLHEVRDLLRHHSVVETERYAHLAEGSLFDAALETRD